MIIKGKTKTLAEFQRQVAKEVDWNSAIGFWHSIFFEMYLKGKMKYSEAIDECKKLADYTGA